MRLARQSQPMWSPEKLEGAEKTRSGSAIERSETDKLTKLLQANDLLEAEIEEDK